MTAMGKIYVRRKSELELELEQATHKLRSLADEKYLMHEIYDTIDECIYEMNITQKDIKWYESHAENERRNKMERIKTLETRDLLKSKENGGCGECQTSCQSACKTSCGVANQKCENTAAQK